MYQPEHTSCKAKYLSHVADTYNTGISVANKSTEVVKKIQLETTEVSQ